MSLFMLTACGRDSPTSVSAEKEPMVIKLSTSTPLMTSQTKGAIKFKELVEEKTNGEVLVDIYPTSQLGSLREQVEATQMGTIQMSISLISTLSTFDENLKVFEYPYLWPTNEDSLWKAIHGEVEEKALESLSKNELTGLGFWAGGFKAITSNVEPVLSPENLEGVNVRVIPSQTLLKQYKSWGGNPVPIDFSELYSALQQGTVDAQENPLETIYTQKYYEVQKYLTLSNHGYQFYIFTVNQDWFDQLPSDIQNVLKEAENEAGEYAIKLNREQNQEYLQELKKTNIKVFELTDEQKEKFIETSTPLQDELSDNEEKKELLELIRSQL
jgi:C4-dicarboxylate-binding protein DctP